MLHGSPLVVDYHDQADGNHQYYPTGKIAKKCKARRGGCDTRRAKDSTEVLDRLKIVKRSQGSFRCRDDYADYEQ
jgi:hypothetical protein